MKYRADIDGLRCLAVLPVILFHAGIPGVSGGFVGVDIFFVISGFLITNILVGELDAGTYSILNFYDRRIRRILPALAFTIALTWIAAYLVFLPSYFVDFSKSVVSVATFTSNLYFWKYSGYFENGAQLRPLLHTWSLAVEEQFYIFMPLLLAFLSRFSKKVTLVALAVLWLLSFGLSVYCTQVASTANFFILPTRAWELLTGGLLAVAPIRPIKNKWLSIALSVVALIAILLPILTYSEATPFPGLSALSPCGGAVLLIYLGAGVQGPAQAILSWRPVVMIGRISYSLYLVHWPVIVFLRYMTLSNANLMLASIALTTSFALAIFSWWFIERPFRNKSFIPSRKILFGGTVAALLVVASIGVAGVTSHGFYQRFATLPASPPEARWKGWHDGVCFFEGGNAFEKWNAGACELTHSGTEAVLLWGDSFAAHYSPGITDHQADFGYRVYQYTAAGCPPVLSYYSYARAWCQPFNQHALDLIKQMHIKKVVLSARWVDLQSRGVSELASTLTALKALGVETYVIGQSPVFVTDVSLIAYKKSDGKNTEDRWDSSVRPDLNIDLKQTVAQAGGDAHFIDPTANLCVSNQCVYRTQGQFVYSDNGHFTVSGSDLAVGKYFPFTRMASAH